MFSSHMTILIFSISGLANIYVQFNLPLVQTYRKGFGSENLKKSLLVLVHRFDNVFRILNT